MARSINPTKTAPQPPRPGRPTLEDAQAIPPRIVKAATGLFVELGFEAASMDLIARRANVSKRTLYARFQNKEEVFVAAVKAMSDSKIDELERFRIKSRTLHAGLEEISRKLVSIIVKPEFIAFERIIAAETKRFPQLAAERAQRGLERLTSIIASVLKKHPPFDAADNAAVELDAKIFLAMAVLPSLRMAMFSDGSIEDLDTNFIGRSVAIFIRGTASSDCAESVVGGNPQAGRPRGPSTETAPEAAPKKHGTRERILHAAMRRFSLAPYDDTGLRDIAADAGVDVAYVHRSFGSKEALFVQALEAASGDDRLAALVSTASSADLPGAIANLFSERRHRDDVAVQPLDIMIRSLGSPTASAVLRRKMLTDLVNPVAAGLEEPSNTRAAMVVAVLVGVGIATSMLRLPGLSRDDAAAGAMLHAVIDAIVTHNKFT